MVQVTAYLLKYLELCSVSYRSTRATNIPGMTISPRPSIEKGAVLLPSSRALGNNNLMGASKDLACTAALPHAAGDKCCTVAAVTYCGTVQQGTAQHSTAERSMAQHRQHRARFPPGSISFVTETRQESRQFHELELTFPC